MDKKRICWHLLLLQLNSIDIKKKKLHIFEPKEVQSSDVSFILPMEKLVPISSGTARLLFNYSVLLLE